MTLLRQSAGDCFTLLYYIKKPQTSVVTRSFVFALQFFLHTKNLVMMLIMYQLRDVAKKIVSQLKFILSLLLYICLYLWVT